MKLWMNHQKQWQKTPRRHLRRFSHGNFIETHFMHTGRNSLQWTEDRSILEIASFEVSDFSIQKYSNLESPISLG